MPADISQLRTLVTDMRAVSPKVVREVPDVVKKGANNVKKTMQADFRKSRSFGQIAGSVNYDVTSDGDGVEAEIGPDKSMRRFGPSLAVIAYWGGANGGGGTVRDPARAMEDEAPKFEQALAKLLGDVL